jgi:sugar diacid utilization regulator
VTQSPAPALRRGPNLDARNELSSMQGLLALSMLMTERGDEQEIFRLAATAVPSLATCQLYGVFSLDAGWRGPPNAGAMTDVADDLEIVGRALDAAAPGRLAVDTHPWMYALELRSLEGLFGYFVVTGKEEPSGAEQFLLRVLAQQTGIALANARLHARERQTAEELRAANAALAETVAALERGTAIHDRLTRAGVSGEGEQGIADAVHEVTGYPVVIEDRHGNLRAWAGPGRPEPYPKDRPATRAAMLRRALNTGKPIRVGARLLTAVGGHDDMLGVVGLVDPAGAAGAQEQVALEHGATVLAMELARLHAVAATELRLGRDLVDELLSDGDEDHSLARAEALGYDLHRPHRVVVVTYDTHTRDDEAVFHDVRRAARDVEVGTLLASRGGSVVVLAERECDWERFRDTAAHETHGTCRIGVGGRCERPSDFPRSYREAQMALRVQRAAGGPDRTAIFDGLGVYRILAEAPDPAGVEHFVREWLGALFEYDARKKTKLVETLSTYFECGRNYDATAKALVTHRNTLKYRLHRIREISGHDLADADTQFNLQLATRAWHTLQALRDNGA